MASRFFRGFSKVFKGPSNKDGFKSPTKYATIGGVKPKVSTKKSDQIKKSNRLIKKLDNTMKKSMTPKMKAEGEKLKKEVKDTQKKIYRSKFAMGGVTGAIDKLRGRARGQEGRKRKFKLPSKLFIVVPDEKGGKKQMEVQKAPERDKKLFGGRIKKKKMPDGSDKPRSQIREKILPKKKKDRLEELRKELGMKKGGSALKPVDKQKNPGLAKLPTQVRNKMGYMKKGGSVKQMVKTVTSPITHLRNKLKSRKFGRGKK